MGEILTLYLLGGAIAVLIALLIVVRIARSMDRASGASTSAFAKLESASSVSDVLNAVGALSRRSRRAEAAPARKKSTTVVALGAMGVALIGLVTAVTSKDSDAPPVQSEISAGALQGTFLDTGKRSEVVLIVPGSGPTDRNGDNPMGVKAQPYRLLAEGLAARGISSVRVDKRGMFESAGAGDGNAVSIDIYADDYRAWIDAIRAQTGKKCIWMLGHSEGALMVSAAAEGRKDVCGLILVSGMGRPMSVVIREQLQANPANAPLLDNAFHALSELEAGRKVDITGMHPALQRLFAPQVQDYLIGILPADPVEVLRKAKKQALIVQGTTDLQTTIEDARLLNTAPRTHLELIQGMNHVLKDAPLDLAANMATYTDPDLPLSGHLVKKIEDFIESDD